MKKTDRAAGLLAALLLLVIGTGTYVYANIVVATGVYLPFGDALAMGWLTNDFPTSGTDQKFGKNLDVDTAEESVWDADDLPTNAAGPARCFVNMAAAANLYVSSDDATDAAKEVEIQLLDANWDAVTVTMDLGAANAGTGTNLDEQIGAVTYLRVNRAFGTTAALVGNLYIHLDGSGDTTDDGIPDTPATDIVAVITAGENQTLQGCYSTPDGFSAIVAQLCLGNLAQVPAAQNVTFRLRSSTQGGAPRTRLLVTYADSTDRCLPYTPPLVFPGRTDIEITAVAAGASQATSGRFGFKLVPTSISGG